MMQNQEYNSRLLETITLQQDKIMTHLKDINELLHWTYQFPRGSTLTSILHLQAGAKVTRIDFTDGTRHSDIPVFDGIKDNIKVLNVPVSRLIIFNFGEGEVRFDTNKDYGDRTADTPVSPDSSWEIITDYPSIKSINILATGGTSATVRLTAIV